VIELHLIGYTEDAEHLVLDLEGEGDGRYTVRIDPDLLATVAQLRDVRVRRGAPVDRRPLPSGAEASPNGQRTTASPTPDVPAIELAPLPAPLPPPRRPGQAPAPARGRTPLARSRAADLAPSTAPTPASAVTPMSASTPDEEVATDEDRPGAPAAGGAASDGREEHRPAALAVPHAKLSPAEIQTQLRAGRSVRTVAAAAGTDVAWIERWLPPILAERARMLDEARRRRVDAPRARPLGVSVDRALTDRGVPEERRTWSATRRADGRWRVSVRFEDSGRPRTATWLMDPVGERLQAASPLAEELAGGAARAPRRR
jgi:hypothetical protein